MEPNDIVAEIGTIHRDLQTRLARLQGLSHSLYQRVRRSPVDDNTAVYMRYASTWSRFAGMASQGVKRASAGNRILKTLASDPISAESIVKNPIRQAPVASTPVESLLDMYSEDSALTDEDIQSVVDGDASEAE
jgi:hypothetical protein